MRTQIVINNTQVDLLKEVSLNITKQLIDIQDPSQRKTDRTLTIEIPGTPENDKLFSYIFEVNIDLDASDAGQQVKHFNPNKKAPVIIFIDSLQQLKGYCQLTDIVITQLDTIQYKIVCYGETGDLFAKIDNQKDEDGKALPAELADLDFSEFDHVYNRTNIVSSWNTNIYVSGSTVAFELGKGYVYPMIDYGFGAGVNASPAKWKVDYFRPAIYVKQYIDKIFQKAGYTYTSNFFNSEFFKRLIIPFNSDKFILDKDEVDSRLFYANRNSSDYTSGFLTAPGNNASAQPIIFNTDSSPFYDNGSVYDTATGKYVCTKAGAYKFTASIEAQLKYIGTPAVAGAIQHPTIGIFKKTGTVVTLVQSASKMTVFLGNPIATNDVSPTFRIKIETTALKLNVGDEFFVAGVGLKGRTDLSSWQLITLDADNSYFNNAVADTTIYEGDTLSLNSCIPTGVKQRDFFGSIIRAFNLYTEPNPDKDYDLIIEPRADYYTGQYTDWTHKLDISKEFTITPMAALDAGEYYFKYTDDEDYLNKGYKQQYERTYGDYKLKVANDFVKNQKKIELIFAPTPSYKEENNPTTRIIPYIGFVDQKNIVTPKTSKIRLLYYGGLKSCDDWSFEALNTSAATYTNYPYAGHLDDPYDSNFDLGFAPPFKLHYSGEAVLPLDYTNINLFTRYWYAQIKEITDDNSKIIEGWFYITPADINNLSFRRYYFIKDAYYRLLKVENYDPVFSKVTKCQFLKVLEFDAPLNVRTRINGGSGVFGTTDTTYKIPTLAGTAKPAGNNFSPGTHLVVGEGNQVAGPTAGVLVTGNENYVFSGSERIAVIGGGSNTIYPGLTDVTLINSSGITVAEPGVLYINNQKYFTALMGAAVSIVTADSPYTLDTSVRTLFCDATGGSITVNLPTAVNNNGKTFEIIKTDSSANTVTIDGFESETINGSATVTLNSQYDKLIIVSNNTLWYKLN